MKIGMIVKVIRPSSVLLIGQVVEVLSVNGGIITVRSGFAHVPVNKYDLAEINVK